MPGQMRAASRQSSQKCKAPPAFHHPPFGAADESAFLQWGGELYNCIVRAKCRQACSSRGGWVCIGYSSLPGANFCFQVQWPVTSFCLLNLLWNGTTLNYLVPWRTKPWENTWEAQRKNIWCRFDTKINPCFTLLISPQSQNPGFHHGPSKPWHSSSYLLSGQCLLSLLQKKTTDNTCFIILFTLNDYFTFASLACTAGKKQEQ